MANLRLYNSWDATRRDATRRRSHKLCKFHSKNSKYYFLEYKSRKIQWKQRDATRRAASQRLTSRRLAIDQLSNDSDSDSDRPKMAYDTHSEQNSKCYNN